MRINNHHGSSSDGEQDRDRDHDHDHKDLPVVDNDDRSSIGNSDSSASPNTIMNSANMNGSATAITSLVAETKQLVITTSAPIEQPERKVSKLLQLPQELFDEITKYLLPANILVLALVNKELMARFMHSAPKPDPSDDDDAAPSWKALNAYIKSMDSAKTKVRGSFLSLLDYDLLDMVYCYKCKKMHDPFISFKDRAYAPRKSSRCADWAPDHHMPPRATRKLLRTITKRRAHGAEYRHLLQQVNNTVTTYQNGILSQTSLRIRFREESQMLRRQQVVSSIDKTALALWLFRQQLLDPAPASISTPKVYRICNHLTWDNTYGAFFDRLTAPLCNGEHPETESHTPACFSRDTCDMSKQEGHVIAERLKKRSLAAKRQPTDVPTLLGDVLGCDKCTTDFNLDVVALPPPFNWGFVLTTWLDLGKIDFSSKWDSHRDLRPGREYKRKHHTHGDICDKFEDLTPMASSSKQREPFRPRISKLNQGRMGNFGWGKRAAAGKDKYITWSSGHSCDPATGWIPDPDPLEKEDY
ncbi:hypothetical protein F4810DRAFT_154932 [Camillea tinctor]|nr:hypothetical protein F4810DRAFT_154932 [Camillea tinctor]